MGSIEKFLKTVCVQDAVYWAPLGVDGFGKMQFSPPVPIKCRWDEVAMVLRDRDGVEIVSNTQVLLFTDVEKQGYLYLGNLTDVHADPMQTENAYPISAFEKTPMIKSTSDFVRKVFLKK